MRNDSEIQRVVCPTRNGESGFTIVEIIIALLILMIAALGVFGVFAYATQLNTGNSNRSQALSVLQKEVELLRSAKFTPTVVSSVTAPGEVTPSGCATPLADNGQRDLRGGDSNAQPGNKTVRMRCGSDRTAYLVATTIDDDPFTANTPLPQVNPATTFKEITVTVTPVGPNGTWITAYQARAVFRRVRAN